MAAAVSSSTRAQCSTCRQTGDMHFSRTQLAKPASARRCKSCIQRGTSTADRRPAGSTQPGRRTREAYSCSTCGCTGRANFSWNQAQKPADVRRCKTCVAENVTHDDAAVDDDYYYDGEGEDEGEDCGEDYDEDYDEDDEDESVDDDDAYAPAHRARAGGIVTPTEMLGRLARALSTLAPVLADEYDTDDRCIDGLRAARFDYARGGSAGHRAELDSYDSDVVSVPDLRLAARFTCKSCSRTWSSHVSTAQLSVQTDSRTDEYVLLACDVRSARQGCLRCEHAGSFKVSPHLVAPSAADERRIACYVLFKLGLYKLSRGHRAGGDHERTASAAPHQSHLCELCQTTGDCPAMRRSAEPTSHHHVTARPAPAPASLAVTTNRVSATPQVSARSTHVALPVPRVVAATSSTASRPANPVAVTRASTPATAYPRGATTLYATSTGVYGAGYASTSRPAQAGATALASISDDGWYESSSAGEWQVSTFSVSKGRGSSSDWSWCVVL